MTRSNRAVALSYWKRLITDRDRPNPIPVCHAATSGAEMLYLFDADESPRDEVELLHVTLRLLRDAV
jgi:hypothetical protein